MKIGELSSLAGCSVPAVRFYEAEGLLQAPLRAANNYRQYGQQHVDRLDFIVRRRLLDDQMRLVERRIAELQALRKQLRAIRSTCAGGVCVGDCGALESLRSATGASWPTVR